MGCRGCVVKYLQGLVRNIGPKGLSEAIMSNSTASGNFGEPVKCAWCPRPVNIQTQLFCPNGGKRAAASWSHVFLAKTAPQNRSSAMPTSSCIKHGEGRSTAAKSARMASVFSRRIGSKTRARPLHRSEARRRTSSVPRGSGRTAQG